MALLNAFCRAWVLGGLVLRRLVLKRLVAGLEVLMTSASELIFYGSSLLLVEPHIQLTKVKE
ncbi:hypothetical protein, partial [Shewanella algae]